MNERAKAALQDPAKAHLVSHVFIPNKPAVLGFDVGPFLNRSASYTLATIGRAGFRGKPLKTSEERVEAVQEAAADAADACPKLRLPETETSPVEVARATRGGHAPEGRAERSKAAPGKCARWNGREAPESTRPEQRANSQPSAASRTETPEARRESRSQCATRVWCVTSWTRSTEAEVRSGDGRTRL